MKAIYKRLAKVRRKLAITQAYWYSWATEYDSRSPSVRRHVPLRRPEPLQGGVFSPMPLLKTYTALARKYRGLRQEHGRSRLSVGGIRAVDGWRAPDGDRTISAPSTAEAAPAGASPYRRRRDAASCWPGRAWWRRT